jgi:hypothetical protein
MMTFSSVLLDIYFMKHMFYIVQYIYTGALVPAALGNKQMNLFRAPAANCRVV